MTKTLTKSKLSIKTMSVSAMMAAVICVLAPIAIPVPTAAASVTLATFAVYLAAGALSPLQSFLSVVLYILLGFAGLPVFSGFTGGAGVIAGPTGGYIIGYIFCVLGAGLLIAKFPGKFYIYPIALIIGTALCYICGTIWFVHLTGKGLAAALSMCVIPFIPLDIIKIIIAAPVGFRLRKTLAQF